MKIRLLLQLLVALQFLQSLSYGTEPQDAKVVNIPGDTIFDYGKESIRYLENARVKLGLNMMLGGAVTYLEDKINNSGNMINSFDWGRQIQLSYYSGPRPFIGPNGERPSESWAGLGWNPIQSGDCGGYRSQVLSFDQINSSTVVLRTRPQLWPHNGIPAECIFECKYTLIDNGFTLEATIINNRSDKTQYQGCHQETPALYTNAPWYKLVSYLGDRPFEGQPTTIIVDKGDQKGWPWTQYYTPESWSALVNENNYGIGVYQPFSTYTTAGFAGSDEDKGKPLGAQDSPTGYIAPLETTILDWNIKRAYRATFIVGSVEEIRETVYKLAKNDIPRRPKWVFKNDRQNWFYINTTDTGFPIKNALHINLSAKKVAIARSPRCFWKSIDAPILEIEAAFVAHDKMQNKDDKITVHIYPVSPYDFIDETNRQRLNEARKKFPSVKEYPKLPCISQEVPIIFDGKSNNLRVDLTVLQGYIGGMQQLDIVLPQREGKAIISSVSFLEN